MGSAQQTDQHSWTSQDVPGFAVSLNAPWACRRHRMLDDNDSEAHAFLSCCELAAYNQDKENSPGEKGGRPLSWSFA